MPTDYAPRKNTPRKANADGKRFHPRSFGGGALVGVALTLALVYMPALSGRGESGAVADGEATAPAMPTLTYEFMDRLPKEQVVTNVTPYEPPVVVDEPQTEPPPESEAQDSTHKDEPLVQDDPPPPPARAQQAQEPAPPPEPPAETTRKQAARERQQLARETPPPVQRPQAMEYMLQAAALPSRDEAEALRARLILDGVSAPVKVVPHPEDGARHRVLVGPFAEEHLMRDAQEELRAKDITALPMRRARSGDG